MTTIHQPISDAEIQNLKELLSRSTPGEWGAGCLGNDDVKCNCAYVLSDHHMGSIATVNINNGIKSIADGGNDSPSEDEAKANLNLIVQAKNALPSLLREITSKRSVSGPSPSQFVSLIGASWIVGFATGYVNLYVGIQIMCAALAALMLCHYACRHVIAPNAGLDDDVYENVVETTSKKRNTMFVLDVLCMVAFAGGLLMTIHKVVLIIIGWYVQYF